MFEIKMTAPELQKFMGQIQANANLYGLPAVIATELYNQTVKNFESNGRPSWAGLHPKTLAKRAKMGIGGENILRVKGKLFDAITPFSGNDFAGVGVSATVPYAAIQHFGGIAYRGAKIPARRYIPIDASGNLQPEAETAIVGVVSHYLRSLGFD